MRRRRTELLILAALVVAVAAAVLGGRGGPAYPGLMDPRNPSGNGGQALARVVEQQGVDVTVARSADDLDRAAIDARTTVVVTSTEQLGAPTVRRLRTDAADARLVLIGARAPVARLFGGDAVVNTLDPAVEAGCDDPRFAGLRLDAVGVVEYAHATGCFAGTDGPVAADAGGATLFGAPGALTNDQVLEGDNAAIGLRLLGERPRLVWYVPTADDLPLGQGVGVASLLPRWLGPGLVLAAVVLVALVLWRARRLGPLAQEPLPVTVRAIETTESRGRLYRRAGDRGHAAEALRTATRRRLAQRLRLSPTADPADVASVVASRSGRPEPEVAALLTPGAPAPTTDHDLVRLADALAAIDREVRP